MKRFSCLVVLMALSSSAHAGGFSFVVGGHRIRIDAPRYCGSPSCVSLSIPGVYETRRRRERNEEFDAAPAKPPAPQPAAAPSAATPPRRQAKLPRANLLSNPNSPRRRLPQQRKPKRPPLRLLR